MFYSSFSHHFFFQTVFVFIFPLPTPFYSSFSHHFFSQTVLVFIFLLPTPFLYFVLPSLLLSDTLCFHFPVTSLTDTFFYSCFYHHFFVQTVFVFIFPSLLSQTPFLFLFLPSLLLSDSLCFHFPFTNTFLFFVLPSLLLSDTLCFHFPVTSLTETFLILVSTITSSLR